MRRRTLPARIRHRAGVRRTLACALLCLAGPALAQTPLEQKVHAAFLYNFAKFIEWPPGTFQAVDQPLNICIAGAEEFARIASADLAGKLAGSRPVQVITGEPGSQLRCHIHYWQPTGEQPLPDIDPPVLTVSRDEGFLDQGGMIQFQLSEQRVRFSINLAAAQDAGLTISAKLLALATQVRRER